MFFSFFPSFDASTEFRFIQRHVITLPLSNPNLSRAPRISIDIFETLLPRREAQFSSVMRIHCQVRRTKIIVHALNDELASITIRTITYVVFSFRRFRQLFSPIFSFAVKQRNRHTTDIPQTPHTPLETACVVFFFFKSHSRRKSVQKSENKEL